MLLKKPLRVSLRAEGISFASLTDLASDVLTLDDHWTLKRPRPTSARSHHSTVNLVDAAIALAGTAAVGVLIRELSNLLKRLIDVGSERIIVQIDNVRVDISSRDYSSSEELRRLLEARLALSDPTSGTASSISNSSGETDRNP